MRYCTAPVTNKAWLCFLSLLGRELPLSLLDFLSVQSQQGFVTMVTVCCCWSDRIYLNHCLDFQDGCSPNQLQDVDYQKKKLLYFKLLILAFIEKCVMLKLIIASQVIGEIFTKWINMIATKIMIGTICALETMKWIIREYCSSPIYICIYLVASELIDTAYHCYIGNILPWTNQLVCFIKKSNYFHLDCITYFAYITLTFLIVRQLHVLDTAKFRMILI